VALQYQVIRAFSASWKGETAQEHGKHFDGIVAGLGRHEQGKMAKKRERIEPVGQTPHSASITINCIISQN
jgi:hypothetical protein